MSESKQICPQCEVGESVEGACPYALEMEMAISPDDVSSCDCCIACRDKCIDDI